MNIFVSLIEHISKDQYLQIILSPYNYDGKRLQNCLELLYLGSQFCPIYLAFRGRYKPNKDTPHLKHCIICRLCSIPASFIIIIINFCKIADFKKKILQHSSKILRFPQYCNIYNMESSYLCNILKDLNDRNIWTFCRLSS